MPTLTDSPPQTSTLENHAARAYTDIMGFFRNISPIRAWRDFMSVWRGEQRHKPRIVLVSLVATGSIFFTFFGESGWEKDPPKYELVYIQNWTLDRSDAEIKADQWRDYKAKLQEEMAQFKRNEAKREVYRKIGRASGMDVDDE